MIYDLLKLFDVTSTDMLESVVCVIVREEGSKKVVGISPDGVRILMIDDWLQDKPDVHSEWFGQYMLGGGGSGVNGE